MMMNQFLDKHYIRLYIAHPGDHNIKGGQIQVRECYCADLLNSESMPLILTELCSCFTEAGKQLLMLGELEELDAVHMILVLNEQVSIDDRKDHHMMIIPARIYTDRIWILTDAFVNGRFGFEVE